MKLHESLVAELEVAYLNISGSTQGLSEFSLAAIVHGWMKTWGPR